MRQNMLVGEKIVACKFMYPELESKKAKLDFSLKSVSGTVVNSLFLRQSLVFSIEKTEELLF